MALPVCLFSGENVEMEKKKELRKRIALLKTLHKSTATHQSAEILAALEAHPVFRAASIILLYHSLPDEVHTHDFIRKMEYKEKNTPACCHR